MHYGYRGDRQRFRFLREGLILCPALEQRKRAEDYQHKDCEEQN
jgi:hypothetical protein